MKFPESSCLLWLYSPVCVGPGQKPQSWFSCVVAHILDIYNPNSCRNIVPVGGCIFLLALVLFSILSLIC